MGRGGILCNDHSIYTYAILFDRPDINTHTPTHTQRDTEKPLSSSYSGLQCYQLTEQKRGNRSICHKPYILTGRDSCTSFSLPPFHSLSFPPSLLRAVLFVCVQPAVYTVNITTKQTVFLFCALCRRTGPPYHCC